MIAMRAIYDYEKGKESFEVVNAHPNLKMGV